mgnify:CR=1 FL=1
MSLRLKLTTLIIMAALLLPGTGVLAAPSLFGPTGLITIPTADVIQPGQFNVAGFMAGENYIVAINGAPIPSLEMGIGVREQGDSPGYLNAKLQVIPETRDFPGIAVGALDIADSLQRKMYVVLSKNMPDLGVRAHLGIETPGDPLFAGVSKVLNTVSVNRPGEKGLILQTILLGEVHGSDLSVGAQIRFTPNITLHLAYHDLQEGVIGLSINGWF